MSEQDKVREYFDAIRESYGMDAEAVAREAYKVGAESATAALREQLAREGLAHMETIDERDRWEDEIGRLATVARCGEEWSSCHEHGNCISEAIASLQEQYETQLQIIRACNDALLVAPTTQLQDLPGAIQRLREENERLAAKHEHNRTFIKTMQANFKSTLDTLTEVIEKWQYRAGQVPVQEPATCLDCELAARHAYSDATTPGFFNDKCPKHREATATCPKCKHPKHSKQCEFGGAHGFSHDACGCKWPAAEANRG